MTTAHPSLRTPTSLLALSPTVTIFLVRKTIISVCRTYKSMNSYSYFWLLSVCLIWRGLSKMFEFCRTKGNLAVSRKLTASRLRKCWCIDVFASNVQDWPKIYKNKKVFFQSFKQCQTLGILRPGAKSSPVFVCYRNSPTRVSEWG